jgi:Flp pilus assembly CpaF family ATPase
MSVRQSYFRAAACPVGRNKSGLTIIWIAQDSKSRREAALALTRLPEDKVLFLPKTPSEVNDKIKTLFPEEDIQGESRPESTLRQIIETAIGLGVSDILIEPEPYQDTIVTPGGPKFPGKVRFDIEGVLDRPWFIPIGKTARQERQFFPDHESYLRVMRLLRSRANVTPDDEGVPGDGRLAWGSANNKTEYRVNIVPTSLGHKAVLRQVSSHAKVIPLERLSFPDAYATAMVALRRKGAFVIICGIPRAGKTTTAYAMITSLPLDELNVYTIENPVEALLPGMSQINIPVEEEMSSDSQMTMAKAMKTLVRQRPDLALLGEIRDKETVENALTIGSSGIGVLATLHAPRATAVFDRLVALGANEDMMRRNITAIIAQELVRRLCNNCKTDDLVYNGSKANPNGCIACNHRGYSGMIAVMEIMERKDADDGTPIWRITQRMEDMAMRAVHENVTDTAEVERVFGDILSLAKYRHIHRTPGERKGESK